uniref:RNA helicase n=1 Tax=Meloidogyne enterolobii TaxID=390850 RepID=A0A6V7V1B3_MELEN|nr:unnamed protein product [Meloidogyne enterolobii]
MPYRSQRNFIYFFLILLSRMEQKMDKKSKNVASDNAFARFDFDDRLIKMIAEMNWETPTPVQASMIPMVLSGKNVLARARTGSGKTAAFLLPLIQNILQLNIERPSADMRGPYVLIVAPTKELTSQIFTQLQQLIAPFPFIQALDLVHYLDPNENQTLNDDLLDILLGTPGRLLAVVEKNPGLLDRIRTVVLDEADLIFSYGYQDEMKKLKILLPKRFQTLMTSATLKEDLSEIQKTFVEGKMLSLKLKERDLPGTDQLEQFHISCQNDEERFTILMALIKLKLLVGKSVVFVSTVDRCYKLYLFLQAFKVPSCVLNAQMPTNSRCRVIREFNQGKWPFLIASECNDIFDDSQEAEENLKGKKNKQKRKELKKNKKRHLDKESGIGRGIDFHLVPNVINFDFPLSTDMYVHRVGRTARGFNKGTAISFCLLSEQALFEQIRQEVNERMGQPVLRPYQVRMQDFEGFQLRAREVLAACTRAVIRETRMAEIRDELLKSKPFEQDKKQYKLKIHSPAIADVPDYLVPKALRGQKFSETYKSPNILNNRRKRKRSGKQFFVENEEGKTNENGENQKRRKFNKQKTEKNFAKRNFQKKMADPLQSFKI